jgi:hypothetical protein
MSRGDVEATSLVGRKDERRCLDELLEAALDAEEAAAAEMAALSLSDMAA